MIPPVERKEWYELVTGSIEPNLTSRLLKIKISVLRRKVNRGLITAEEAVKELMKECEKHYDLYRQDLQVIFKNKKESAQHS